MDPRLLHFVVLCACCQMVLWRFCSGYINLRNFHSPHIRSYHSLVKGSMKPNEEAGDGDDNIYQDLNKRMKELGIDKSKVISECLDNEGSEIASSMKGYLTQYYENQNITQNSLQWQVYEAELRTELDSLGTDGEDDASENTASMRQTYFQQYPEAREEDLSKDAANQFPPSTVSSTENIDFSKSPSQVSVENIMSMREKYYEKFRETKKDLGQENPLDNSNKIDEDSEHLGSSSSLRNPNDAEQVLSDTQWQELLDPSEVWYTETTKEKLVTDHVPALLDLAAAVEQQEEEGRAVGAVAAAAAAPAGGGEGAPAAPRGGGGAAEEVGAFLRRKYYATVAERKMRGVRPDQRAFVPAPAAAAAAPAAAPAAAAAFVPAPAAAAAAAVARGVLSGPQLARLEAAERKHSRAAMLGLGVLAGLASQGLWGGGGGALLSLWQVDLAICIVVIYELQYYFREGQAFESMVEKSLSSWLNQNAVSNKKWDINVASFVDQLKQSEIKHGRMAMLAITSFFLFVETETGLAGPALATVVQPFLPH